MTSPAPHLATVLERLARPRILVVGDLMLDHYVFGKVERISPEAPIQVLRVEREEDKPGGAGSVVTMLRKLEAEVAVVGAVGRDEAGEKLVATLEGLGADVSGIVRVEGRPTTLKTRCIASVQHLLRIDREVDGPYAPEVDAALSAHVRRLLPSCALVSISDYGKGLLKGGLLATIAAERKRLALPAILDPKKQADYSSYRGVSAITPNRAETELATGIRPREADPASWRAAGEKLVRDLDLECAVITLDKEGIYFHPRAGEPKHFPTQARSVYDVTGAGDMVVSMIGLCRASGVDWPDALALANVAAGVEVSRVGVAPLSRREVLEGLLERDQPFLGKIVTADEFAAGPLPELRRKRKRIAFTNGCFDILHVGHVNLFTFARAQADCLVVGLNSDRSTREIKGPGRPIIGEGDRAHLLAALEAVDFVVLFDEPTPIALIEKIVPDVLIKAEDYRGRTVVGQSVVEAAGGRVVLAPLVGGISTTEIARRLASTSDEAAAKAARAAAEQAYDEAEKRARGSRTDVDAG
jgi:D-beta-D-heptose 7-phosphate kinase/D-beta-D-heptose 1-phosphate adenosyltransferase